MNKHFCITILLLGVFLCADAQKRGMSPQQKKKEEKDIKKSRINALIRQEEEGIPSFSKQSIFSLKSSHDGYGLLYEKGRSKSVYSTSLLQFEFGEKQHQKEQKQSTSAFSGGGFSFFGRPFVYGKRNIFYQLKAGAGKQIMIGGKGNKNGVAVYGTLIGGFSAGLSRPYYIEFNSPGGVQAIKYTGNNRDVFLNADRIIGGTGLQRGWNEMKFNPGFYGKAGLRFDWARFNQQVSAIEFGFGFDYYTKKVEQMVDLEGKSFFPSGYVALVFGSRK